MPSCRRHQRWDATARRCTQKLLEILLFVVEVRLTVADISRVTLLVRILLWVRQGWWPRGRRPRAILEKALWPCRCRAELVLTKVELALTEVELALTEVDLALTEVELALTERSCWP